MDCEINSILLKNKPQVFYTAICCVEFQGIEDPVFVKINLIGRVDEVAIIAQILGIQYQSKILKSTLKELFKNQKNRLPLHTGPDEFIDFAYVVRNYLLN